MWYFMWCPQAHILSLFRKLNFAIPLYNAIESWYDFLDIFSAGVNILEQCMKISCLVIAAGALSAPGL